MSNNKKNKRLLDEFFKSSFDKASVNVDDKLWHQINTKLKAEEKSNNKYGIFGLLALLILFTTSGIAYLYFNERNDIADNEIVNNTYGQTLTPAPLIGENDVYSILNKSESENSDQKAENDVIKESDEKASLIKDLQNAEQKYPTLPAQTFDDENKVEGIVLSENYDETTQFTFNKLKLIKNKLLDHQYSQNLNPTHLPDKKEIDEYLISSAYDQNKKWSLELSGGPVHIQTLMKWNNESTTTESKRKEDAIIGYEGGMFGRYYFYDRMYIQTGIKAQYYSAEKELTYYTKKIDTTYVSKEYDSLIFYPKISLARFEKAWKEEQIISQTELLNSQLSNQKLVVLNIPLMLGYTIQKGKFTTSVESGIAFTRLIHAEADVLNKDSSVIITYTHKDKDLPYRKNSFGILSRFSMDYQIHNFWAITLNPYVYLNLHEAVSSNGFVEHKGVSVGLRYIR